MALINCPECNKQISDKAYACPHCGYPISIKNSNDDKYDVTFISFSQNNDYKIKTIKYLRELLNLSLSDAVNIGNNAPCVILKNISFDKMKKVEKTFSELDCKIEISQSQNNIEKSNSDNDKVNDYYENENILRCPRCGSTNVAIGQRGYSLVTGFWGSNKTVNRCGKCGYSWKP